MSFMAAFYARLRGEGLVAFRGCLLLAVATYRTPERF
jgi:hypothetical protein